MTEKELSLWSKKTITLLWVLWIIWYLLYALKWLLIIIIISGFITIIINPLVIWWERYRVPAWISVILTYIILIFLWSVVVWTVIPIVVTYISDTATMLISWVNTAQGIYLREGITGFHFHPYVERLINFLFWKANFEHVLDIIKQNAGNIQSFVTTQISSLTTGGISIVSTVWGVLTEWLLIGMITFFMVLERASIGRFILSAAPKNIEVYLKNHYIQIQGVCNAWIKSSLLLSLSIFIITYIGLFAVENIFGFHTDRIFTLAIISGIMEFIPYVGPLIALIPALIIGLGISWEAAGVLTILYLIIQQVENNVLVPYIMSKNLDLSPLLVFLVMLAWAILGWILGIILAIPVAWILKVVYTEYRKDKTELPIPLPEKVITRKAPAKKLTK